MCGLIGAYGPSARVLASRLEAAVCAIRHRGPDAMGVFRSQDSSCILGHRRLSIIDLSSSADQPMVRNGAAVAYNGEIYNHLELRAQLNHSVRFQTRCDTETLLEGLRNEGSSFLNRAIGMFAGAFYDPLQARLMIFRDTLGIKPLYYARLPDSTCVFGSEIKAIFELAPELMPEADPAVLKAYLLYENFPQGSSLFRGIRSLKPGEILKLSETSMGQVHTSSSSINFCDPQADAPANDDVYKLIERSVRWHLMSDVPVGVYLSGGWDSSAVAAFASRAGTELLGFTGFFETGDAYYDERPISREVARSLGISLVEVPITPEDLKRNLDSLVWALDEPRMGMGSFSQDRVAREAATRRKVILSGHGGDEVFCGYPLFKAMSLMTKGRWAEKARTIGSLSKKEWPWAVNTLWCRLRNGHYAYAPELFPLRARLPNDETILNAFKCVPGQDPLSGLEQYYRNIYLPGLLVVEDKVSMAHSLETRTPLWSQPLLDWAKKISIRERLPGGRLKGLLREAVQPLLPEAIAKAPKRGFPTPLRLWFRRELREFVRERLLSGVATLHDLVPRPQIESLLNSHQRTPLPFALDERRAHQIWILLSLESWLRQYRVSVRAAS